AHYPNVGQSTRCEEAVQGKVPVIDRRYLRDLIQKEPTKDDPFAPSYAVGLDFKQMESHAYWVIYAIEGGTPTTVSDDESIVPGSMGGSLVVFEAKTSRVACQAPVNSRGSDRITAYVRTSDASGERVRKARQAAYVDLETNFRHAVGDGLAT